MKNLKRYIEEKLIVFHPVDEKLIVNKNYNTHKYHPTSPEELRQIILDRYKKQGPGTKQEPIDFNDINVSGMTSFHNKRTGYGIFESTRFKYIDVSDWDVSNVIYMYATFYDCQSLQALDLSKWNVSNVENMCGMFTLCRSLKELNISNWDISNVKYMVSMFEYCKNLKSVGDLSNWDVSNVEEMTFMFANSGITNIPDWYKK